MKVTLEELKTFCWGAYLTDDLPQEWGFMTFTERVEFFELNVCDEFMYQGYKDILDRVESDANAMGRFIIKHGGEVIQ